MQNKLDYIVFLRILATIAVVINHTFLVSLGTMTAASLCDTVFVQTIVHIVHFAVPLFVMITGALLLDSNRVITFEKAIKKYAWRMIVVIITIGWLFAFMECYFKTRSINLDVIIDSFMCVLTGNSWEHMWYLYMLIGLYLVIPFIKASLKVLTTKSIDCFILILFLFTSIIPMIEQFADVSFGIRFPIPSVYILYLLLGWRIPKLVDNIRGNRIKKIIMPLIIGISLILGICPYFEYYYNVESLKWIDAYNCPIEVIEGILIFAWVYLNIEKLSSKLYRSKVSLLIDRNSFGIYLFHMLWINVLYKVVHLNPLNSNWMLFLVAIFIGLF